MTGENLINYQPAMIETLEPLIELRGISKTFGNNKVLDNVSDEALESILSYLKQLISKSENDLILSNNLNKILAEDKEVLERLAK